MRAITCSTPSKRPIGRIELAADARIGAGGEDRRPARRRWRSRAARCSGRPRAARPACASREPAIFSPPMMQSSGTNTSWPRTGPFWNGMLSGKWRRPISMPGVSRGISAQVMPIVGLLAEQMLRVEHAKRQAHHGRHRRQRDVALGEVELQADDLAALPDRPRHTTPVSGIAAASEPTRGPVSAKQGISSPRARRGR